MNKKTILFLTLAILWIAPVKAGDFCLITPTDTENSDCNGNVEERQKWFNEVRELKHQYLIKELDLKKDQQQEFFRIYDTMEDENRRIQAEARCNEKRVAELGDKATDQDFENASQMLFQVKEKEATVDAKYYVELKKVLSPKQLFKLKSVERKFTRELMNRHHQLKKKGPKK